MNSNTNDEVVYKEVAGHPGYRVGTDGSVWTNYAGGRSRTNEWRLRNPCRNKDGYLNLILSNKDKRRWVMVHRLVLETFVGPRPEGHEARHLNGIPTDNRLANLRWGTSAENKADMISHGTTVRGTRHRSAKLDEHKVLSIRSMRSAGQKLKVLADQFGVTEQTISAIATNKIWRHV